MTHPPGAEWLEPDGLGGFASGTVSGIRTRRYHALLLAASTPPTGRFVLVNGFEAWVETPAGRCAISSQAYMPGVVHPDGAARCVGFSIDPWPRWIFRLDDGTLVEQEIFVAKGAPTVAICWRVSGQTPREARLIVRPLMSGRDFHATHHENQAFRFRPDQGPDRLTWRVYDGLPPIVSFSNGTYRDEPTWYRNFLYEEERARGLDPGEDLASPGLISFDLRGQEAFWILRASEDGPAPSMSGLRAAEMSRRGRLKTPLERAGDVFLVKRGDGRTILAGYPWFTDWGRDTFVAIRGLCLGTGRLEEARSILIEWSSAISEGMVPNVFPDGNAAPEYNAADASLWYVIAVEDFIKAAQGSGARLASPDRLQLVAAVEAILDAYARGTRFGIRCDRDGLLAAGVPGAQLTWMDSRIGDRAVTPRIGKPVEVQALWINALAIGAEFSRKWRDPMERALGAFKARFWNESAGCLYDVVDVDHRFGVCDASFRPNQIFAVGGLPMALIDGGRARQVVDAVERRLLTPMGLRSLAPSEPGYTGRYEGGPMQRDAAYHQGTVWPWLLGAFTDAWVRVRGSSVSSRSQARDRFLAPLLRHLGEAGLGSLPEIADGDPPHTPRGCPFQAWSVGEAIRMDRIMLQGDP